MEIGAEISKKIRVGNGLIIFIMLQFYFVHDEEEMHFMGMAGILLTLCNGRSKLLASPRYLNPTDSGSATHCRTRYVADHIMPHGTMSR